MTIAFRDIPGGTLAQSLAQRSRLATLPVGEGVPALLCHPGEGEPAPVLIWMHGRTVDKFLDPGRYSRLVRAGVAVCAIDLPGHGERAGPRMRDPTNSLEVIERASGEIDGILGSLGGPEITRAFGGAMDTGRAALGGMSLGGMVTLNRLTRPHPFRCASVEATSGNLKGLYFGEAGDEGGTDPADWPVTHDPGAVARVDPIEHLTGFEPLPLLALHSETDAMVPWPVQSTFLDRLRARYRDAGADPALIRVRTWPKTGAPAEHVGFGRVSAEAKSLQTAFLVEHLLGPSGSGVES